MTEGSDVGAVGSIVGFTDGSTVGEVGCEVGVTEGLPNTSNVQISLSVFAAVARLGVPNALGLLHPPIIYAAPLWKLKALL